MLPLEIPTHETLRFVLESIPAHKLRILEVGCGSGDLARQLHDLGHKIIAIDSSAEAIEDAKKLGIDARIASFPDFEESEFDAILFTRSLHHIHPLGAALDHARRLLKLSGRLVVEDFAFAEASHYVAAWHYTVLKLLDSADLLMPVEESFGRKVLKSRGDIALWHEHAAKHEISTAQEVHRSIQEHFEILRTESTPYLYRYLVEIVPETEQGAEIVLRVLELEKRTGRKIKDFFLGRRFVARP